MSDDTSMLGPSAFLMAELKEALRERGLRGVKADLILRLEKNDPQIWVALTKKRDKTETQTALAVQALQQQNQEHQEDAKRLAEGLENQQQRLELASLGTPDNGSR